MISYKSWGVDLDKGSQTQMEHACLLPVSRKAALMPDAHQGYGLPIGGVLATENAVIPYGVGVDIACRMRLTITDGSIDSDLDKPLERETRFGMGCTFKRRRQHDVMDHPDWHLLTDRKNKPLKDVAWSQLGTSGSGNHFVEWGMITLNEELNGLSPGTYVGLLSHSGSRGPGAKTCHKYTKIAKDRNPAGELSWLDLDTEDGQMYWKCMQLMGEYAKANHECIHHHVLKAAGFNALTHIENHHNFAWEEDGLIVHRKGATPAKLGELGIIPGSMTSPAFLVRGKGNPDSINSAAHGAGRAMSRSAAKLKFTWRDFRDNCEKANVRVLGAGLDEIMGAYKDIHEVMAAQTDLVDTIGSFHPRVVMMCNDGSRPED